MIQKKGADDGDAKTAVESEGSEIACLASPSSHPKTREG